MMRSAAQIHAIKQEDGCGPLPTPATSFRKGDAVWVVDGDKKEKHAATVLRHCDIGDNNGVMIKWSTLGAKAWVSLERVSLMIDLSVEPHVATGRAPQRRSSRIRAITESLGVEENKRGVNPAVDSKKKKTAGGRRRLTKTSKASNRKPARKSVRKRPDAKSKTASKKVTGASKKVKSVSTVTTHPNRLTVKKEDKEEKRGDSSGDSQSSRDESDSSRHPKSGEQEPEPSCSVGDSVFVAVGTKGVVHDATVAQVGTDMIEVQWSTRGGNDWVEKSRVKPLCDLTRSSRKRRKTVFFGSSGAKGGDDGTKRKLKVDRRKKRSTSNVKTKSPKVESFPSKDSDDGWDSDVTFEFTPPGTDEIFRVHHKIACVEIFLGQVEDSQVASATKDVSNEVRPRDDSLGVARIPAERFSDVSDCGPISSMLTRTRAGTADSVDVTQIFEDLDVNDLPAIHNRRQTAGSAELATALPDLDIPETSHLHEYEL